VAFVLLLHPLRALLMSRRGLESCTDGDGDGDEDERLGIDRDGNRDHRPTRRRSRIHLEHERITYKSANGCRGWCTVRREGEEGETAGNIQTRMDKRAEKNTGRRLMCPRKELYLECARATN
jgi:hypothetical protein